MDPAAIILAIVIFLAATAVCVILFQRLGFGSVLGFIVAGIVIGPHTPGPVAYRDVAALQHVAEIGVVLFMFTVGLEMRPRKVWAMRRLLFGMGSAQMLVTAAILGAYFGLVVDAQWEAATVVALAFAMSSTAIVMAMLGERGQLSSEHGQASFAVLMAQDMWIVPIMALVPILAHRQSETGPPLWEQVALVLSVLAGIFIVGRYLLPAALGRLASARRMEGFGIVLFLAVLAAAWAVEHAGVSMTLGAFVLGMLLSASDYRYQIEATVAPFKNMLMGLFFIAVGMSIDVGALMRDWTQLLFHVPAVLVIKVMVVIGLAHAFGVGRAAAIRTGFYLSQAGELAFVLLGAAAAAGMGTSEGHTLAMLVVAMSMILTPLMVKSGDRLALRFDAKLATTGPEGATALERHVVIVGCDEVGKLISLMLEQADIPHVVFDHDIEVVRKGQRAGRNAHFGDMRDPSTQEAAGLGKAAAVFISSTDMEGAKELAVTLHRLYSSLHVYVRVRSLDDQDELVAKGVKHAGTAYIESTLLRGSMLLKDLGVAEDDVDEIVQAFQSDDRALIRSVSARATK